MANLSGRSVLLAVSDQLISGLAMIGNRRRGAAHAAVSARSQRRSPSKPDRRCRDRCRRHRSAGSAGRMPRRISDGGGSGCRCRLPRKPKTERATEWLMLTSGTSGVPKIVGHTLEGLTGAIVADGPARGARSVWATFYDIRRYGGLQIFLRAIIGGGSMVLSEPGEALADHVARLQRARRHAYFRHAVALAQAFDERIGRGLFAALRSPVGRDRRPGGARRPERRPFPTPRSAMPMPRPRPASALPSMTASRAFPPSMIGRNRDGVEMKVEDGSLRIRSTRTAHAYVGRNAAALTDRRRLRRHRRHGGAARRPLSLRRPARRHHQYRRA